MKLYKNSTYNIKKTFKQVTLASLYISQLCAVLETSFSQRADFKDSKKLIFADIFSLIYYLWAEGYIYI